MPNPQTNQASLVVDTCLFLAAVGVGANSPDNNSPHDRDLRNRNIDPEKVRGFLIAALATNNLVIPHIVFRELESHLKNPKLSQKNQKNLQELLNTIQPHTEKLTPTRWDVYMQKNGMEAIKTKALLELNRIKTEGGIRWPYNGLEKWENLDPHLKDPNDPPEIQNFKSLAKKSPVYLTWLKLRSWENTVISNVDTLTRKTHILKTEQITLQEETTLLLREMEIEETEETPQNRPLPPIVHAILEDYVQKNQENPFVNKTEKNAFNPTTFRCHSKAKQVACLEWLSEQLRPKMIPDVEIALSALLHKAQILTLDNDFSILQENLQRLKHLPKPITKTIGPPQPLSELLQTIKKNFNCNKTKHTATHEPSL